MTTNPNGKYASVNGVKLYYEVFGAGRSLILLHGGFATIDMFAALIPELARTYQVIGVDLYGHGRTALTDRPFSFENMADDIAGLIEHLGLEKATVLGYSLGGSVALQTAFRHPDRVDKLVVVSSSFKRAAWYPEARAGMEAIAPEPLLGTPVYDTYVNNAPKPEDFSRFVNLMRETLSRDYDWKEQVSALKSPTLVVAGDADGFPPSHVAEFYTLLGGGLKDAGWDGSNLIPSQLAILPGTTHYNILFSPNLPLPVLTSFLSEKQTANPGQ